MGEKTFLKSFEDFKGLDYKRSPLTAQSNEATDLQNLKFNRGYSLQSSYGFNGIGGPGGFVSMGVFSYFDNVTGASKERLVGINDQLFYLDYGTLTITRTAGAATWGWEFFPNASGTDATFRITEGGVVIYSTTVTATTTVYDIRAAFGSGALVNYSCTSTGKFALSNSNYTGNAPTVAASNTYAFGDLVTFIDTKVYTSGPLSGTPKNMLTARRVLAVGGGPVNLVFADYVDYDISAGTVTVTNNQVFGPQAAPFSGVAYQGANEQAASTSQTIQYPYWAPTIWNTDEHMPFKGHYQSAALGYREFRHATFASAGNRLFIGSAGLGDRTSSPTILPKRTYEGFPHCFDGREVYRAGLPKGVINSLAETVGAGSLTGRYRYKVVYKYYSQNGDLTFGQPSEFSEITVDTAPSITVTFRTPRFAQATAYSLAINSVGNVLRITNVAGMLEEAERAGQPRDNTEVVFLGVATTPDLPVRRKIVSYVATTPIEITIDGPAPAILAGANIYINTIEGLPDRGASCSAAINGNTVFVVSDHNVYVGDTIYFNYPSTVTGVGGKLVSRKVTAVTATQLTFDGARVETGVAVPDVISTGLVAEIYRTTAGGTLFYKVAEQALVSSGVSWTSTQNYVDTFADAALGEQLIEPEIGKERDMPPRARIIVGHQGGLVYTGVDGEPNSIAWNDLNEGLEAVPLASNYTDIASTQVAPISAATSFSDDSLMVFKPAACYALSGDLNAGAFVSRPLSEGDYGISAQGSIQKISGLVVGVGELGLNLFSSNGPMKEFGQNINTEIRNNSKLLLEQATSVNDYANRFYRIFIPRDGTGLSGQVLNFASDTDSIELAYDYEQDAWFNQEPFRSSTDLTRVPSAGMAMLDNKLVRMSRAGYGVVTGSAAQGVAWLETNSVGLGTFTPGWLYCEGLKLPTTVFKSDWIHLGEPSLKKVFLRLKLFRFVDVGEQDEVSANVTYQVKIYRDWYDTTAYFTTNVTFTGYGDVEKIIKIENKSAKAIKIEINNSPNTALHTFFLTGWELLVSASYLPEDFLGKTNA